MEVEFVTLGDASDRLATPSATLRNWTDQLEEYEVHYTKRNNRNERIYYDNDLEIFKFLKDMKAEYGRRTTTKDLAYMIAEKGKEGRFELRGVEDAPIPSNPSNKTADLLSQEDIQRLMQSERVKQFIGIVIKETQDSLREELVQEIREVVATEVRKELETENDRMEKIAKRMEDSVAKRDALLMQMFEEDKKRKEEANKGFFAKLFGK